MAQDQGTEASGQEPLKINRRRLIGNAAKAIAGTAVGITVGREVLQTVTGKVETEDGIFYPLYEVHKYPIEKLPKDLDVYFREVITKPDGIPASLTDNQITGLLGFQSIKNEIVRQGAKIALGDIIPTSYPLFPDQVFGLAMVVGANALGTTAAAAGATLGTLLETRPASRKMARRTAIGFLGAATYSATTAGNLLLDQETLSKGLNQTDPTGDALGRITVKINGLISDFHPEIALLFFRNAVWAHKFLEYSKELKTELKRKPNIALAIGAAHAGVEDFLTMGEDFIEKCITSYPKAWLEALVDVNGGIKSFSSLKLIEPGQVGDREGSSKPIKTFEDKKLEGVLDDLFKRETDTNPRLTR